ncbi:hypothetical protein [Actinomadura roseirufa]|uniref:hypothetical protein n=1 Tax=Actinomadura roseirufa TaxID=2094049 RepID=UPI001A955DEF|nr:hypothetical protein [Actinomadura roseirufa]
MRKIVITGVAAVLALGLTACNGTGDGKSAAAPSSPVGSVPATGATSTPGAPSPGGASTPGGSSTPGGGSTPGGSSAPRGSGGSGAPVGEPTSPEQAGGKQVKTAWGRLQYLAPGKFTVGNVVFFTAGDTDLYVAGGKCPDGADTPPDVMKCSMTGFDEWVQAEPHNATVKFSGQAATLIRETQ